ncbi:hypothetical protein [Methylophaga thalassica]|nr:hypothetical protein [Methylophaga thalassica]
MQTSNHILVLLNNIPAPEVWVTEVLKNSGFPFTIESDLSDPIDINNYGSIVSLSSASAPSNNLLDLNLNLASYESAEFYLGENDELFCEWILTDHASIELEVYIRSLWSLLYIA